MNGQSMKLGEGIPMPTLEKKTLTREIDTIASLAFDIENQIVEIEHRLFGSSPQDPNGRNGNEPYGISDRVEIIKNALESSLKRLVLSKERL